MRQKERGALTAETAGDPGSSDALDPGSCSRNSSCFFLFYEIRNCRREFPDSRHKPEGKEVFIRRIQKRGTGNSDSVP